MQTYSKQVAVIDYDAGNIKSVVKALQYLGFKAFVTRKESEILSSSHVILPGVGSFADAMEHLVSYDLIDVIMKLRKEGNPFLGICLGLQILFEDSEESPGVKGLSILKGHVKRLKDSEGLKVPDIGWKSCSLVNSGRLFSGIKDEPFFYFVHSYYLSMDDEEKVRAVMDYGGTRTHASIEDGNFFACQFHPEKSGDTGLKVLSNFLSQK